jgi:hypothetical protein
LNDQGRRNTRAEKIEKLQKEAEVPDCDKISRRAIFEPIEEKVAQKS